MTQQEIFDKFPEMFKERHLDKTQSCMYWGLEVPDSWLPTIYELCDALQNRGWTFGGGPISRPQVIAEQVKTKFGHLRFYFRFEHTDTEWIENATEEQIREINRKYHDYYQGMVDMADNMLYNMEYEIITDEKGNKKVRRRNSISN